MISATNNPVFYSIPVPLITSRLIVREPRAEDAQEVFDAIKDSLAELRTFLPFASEEPSFEDTYKSVVEAVSNFLLRKDLRLHVFNKETGLLVGSSGLHHINWELPSFEIGYWVRSSEAGKGYITESTAAITRFAFEQLQAKRVQIVVDSENEPSLRIPQKLGFHQEGIMKNSGLLPFFGKAPRHKVIFARYDSSGLEEYPVSWKTSYEIGG